MQKGDNDGWSNEVAELVWLGRAARYVGSIIIGETAEAGVGTAVCIAVIALLALVIADGPGQRKEDS